MSTDRARPGTIEGSPSAGPPPRDEPVVVFAALDESSGTETPAPAPPPAPAPVWFKGKDVNGKAVESPARSSPPPVPRAASSPSTKPPRGRLRIETAPDDDEHLTRSEKLKRWLLGTAGLSYGASMLFHVALLVIMALIVYHSLSKDERGSLLLDTREDEEISLSEVDTRIDMPAAEEDLVPPQFQAIPTPETDSDFELHADLDDVLPSVGGTDEGTGGGTGLALPRGENAVTKGSFTAWTIPEDPEPTKDYVIVIEIRLPDRVRTYRLIDLEGVVIGTDLYTQTIPYDSRNPSSTLAVRDGKPVTLRDVRASVPVHDGRAQLLIVVPGAPELVRDTIRVRSKLLRESQELEIQF